MPKFTSSLCLTIALTACTLATHAAVPQPVLIGEAILPGAFPPHFPCRANGDGTVGFRVTNRISPEWQLTSVDLTSGLTLNILDTLDLEPYIFDSQAMRIVGDRLYLVPDLAIVDISDPSNLSVLGSAPGLARPGFGVGATSMAVQGTTVFVLLGSRNVGVYDCSDPTNIVQTATIQISGAGAALSIDSIGDDKLIIGRSFSGVTIHDSSNPSVLPVIGSVSGFQPSTIDVNDALDVAYAVREDATLIALTSIDISDPTSPSVLDQVEMNDLALFENAGPVVAIGDDIVVAYAEYGRVEMFDVSDPADMVRMDPIDADAESFAPIGTDRVLMSTNLGIAEYAFVSCPADLNGDGELDFFDISAFLSAYNAQDPAADFTADGVFDFFDISAFLSAYNAGCP